MEEGNVVVGVQGQLLEMMGRRGAGCLIITKADPPNGCARAVTKPRRVLLKALAGTARS